MDEEKKKTVNCQGRKPFQVSSLGSVAVGPVN